MRKIFFISNLFLLVFVACHTAPKENEKEKEEPKEEGTVRYLENDRVKLGIDLALGGAVTYLSDQENGGKNMINSFDWGRQIQMSYYSGPWPYIGPNGEVPEPNWAGLGWNPIQSGDAGNNRSQVLAFEYRGKNAMYVRSIPMQWPHRSGIAGECEFETLYTLEGNLLTMEATINNKRSDKTQYRGVTQEMPALYTNGPWYKLITYLGDNPFQGEPVTTVVKKYDGKGWPWVHFYNPEQWVALLNDSGKGIGVFQPDAMTFNAGFHGGDPTKGIGKEKDGQTGHIAPTSTQILDHNIRWTYKTSFVLGTLEDIRSYAQKNWQAKKCPDWSFTDSRHYWHYSGDAGDKGWPIKGQLDIHFEKDACFVGPVIFWKAADAPFLEIEGAFDGNNEEMTIMIEIQPVGKSDFTDWLNWSEGIHDTQKEKREKAAQYPETKSFTIVEKVKADGNSRVYRIDLSKRPEYQGAMKKITIGFTEKGNVTMKSVKLSS